MPRHQIGKTDLSDYATTDYVDEGTWLMPPIIDWYDPTGGLPVDPEVGDRYGADATANGWEVDHIYEWTGAEWEESDPVEGWMLWCLVEMLFYIFLGSGGWEEVGSDSYLKLDQTTPQTTVGTFIFPRVEILAGLGLPADFSDQTRLMVMNNDFGASSYIAINSYDTGIAGIKFGDGDHERTGWIDYQNSAIGTDWFSFGINDTEVAIWTKSHISCLVPFGIRETGSNPQYYTWIQGGDQTADMTWTFPTGLPSGTGFPTGPKRPLTGAVAGTPGAVVMNWCDQSVETTSDVTFNTLIANGLITANAGFTSSTMTSGSVLFAGTAGLISQDNSNFFWNNIDKRLGLGLSTNINAKLTFAAATNAAGGILFGTDTTLYRAAADMLKTDDAFTCGGLQVGQSIIASGLVVNEDGLGTAVDDFRVESDNASSAFEVDASADQININVNTQIVDKNIILGVTTGTKIGTAITQKMGFYNATPIVQPATYTASNVSADRNYDANATMIDEIADVLGTLITDLKALGLVG
jgi:hypothetical protein